MAKTATEARDVLADITSTACDAQTTPEAVLDCFDAALLALNAALSVKAVA